MVISRVSQTIDAVVSELSNAGLTVYDGPEPHDNLSDCVYIGYDAIPISQGRAVRMNQEWSGSIGTGRRDETFDIFGSVLTTVGDSLTTSTSKAAREAAYDLLEIVESTLRANPSLGFTAPFVAGVKPQELYYHNINDGIQARIVFLISVRTRV